MSEREPRLAIPLVDAGVPDSEFYHQIVDSLFNLSAVVDTVFDRVETRISDETLRVHALTDRISQCQTRLDSLTTNRVAFKVEHPQRFPITLP
eukprot:g13644.t1